MNETPKQKSDDVFEKNAFKEAKKWKKWEKKNIWVERGSNARGFPHCSLNAAP